MSSSPLRSAAGCAVSNADSRSGVAVITTCSISLSADHAGAPSERVATAEVKTNAGVAREERFMATDLAEIESPADGLLEGNGHRDGQWNRARNGQPVRAGRVKRPLNQLKVWPGGPRGRRLVGCLCEE